jgi:hypothetical protein
MQSMLQVRQRTMHGLYCLLHLVIDVAAFLACLHRAVAQFFQMVNAVQDALLILFRADHRRSLTGFPLKLSNALP